MDGLQCQVVLITGASAGIGQALARENARWGAAVVLTGRRLDRLTTLAEDLTRQGARALAVACDVTQDGDVEHAVAETLRHFGRLDVVIANAGFGVVGPFVQLSIDDYRRQMETNVFGVLRTLYAAMPELRRQHGRIAIISSVSGYVASPGISPYCMSKFALQALAGGLRYELQHDGISVTNICPGFVESEIRQVDNSGIWHQERQDPIPSWLAMRADTAPKQIMRAILKRKGEVIITGHGKLLVWIQRHAPAFFASSSPV
jgi:short-subunit dehydrogenase